MVFKGDKDDWTKRFTLVWDTSLRKDAGLAHRVGVYTKGIDVGGGRNYLIVFQGVKDLDARALPNLPRMYFSQRLHGNIHHTHTPSNTEYCTMHDLGLTAVQVKSSAKGISLWTRYIASAKRGATLSSLILVHPERSFISPSLVLTKHRNTSRGMILHSTTLHFIE